MAGSCWRLLAAFLLILVAALLRGQDAAPGHSSIPVPNAGPPRYALAGGSDSNSSSTGLPERLPGAGAPAGRYPPVSGPVGFPQIAQPAGIIFSGTVAAIARASPSKEAASTGVTFKVEQAIRGASVGQNLTIHEWAGLWARGESYRVGERVFLFLYPPSKLGLTSPVAGGMGRFGVDSDGKILLNAQHVQLLATDPILGGKTVVSYNDLAVAVEHCKRIQ
jgi:hypothetical protein